MRRLLFLIIAVLVISSCSKSAESGRIELKNLEFIEPGNESANHTALIEAYNGNNFSLNCNLIITKNNSTFRQNIGEFRAFESRNISADVAFPEGNSSIKFSAECSRI